MNLSDLFLHAIPYGLGISVVIAAGLLGGMWYNPEIMLQSDRFVTQREVSAVTAACKKYGVKVSRAPSRSNSVPHSANCPIKPGPRDTTSSTMFRSQC